MQNLVVIGGGAAGFFCAINAAMQQPKLQITILEKNTKLLSKVKISGGGRCNVTHACFDIDELSKKYPRGEKFVKKAFHWFNTQHTIDWFLQQGIDLKTEADNRMFPASNTSDTIIQCLLKLVGKYNIQIQLQTEVSAIQTQPNNSWEVKTNRGALQANYICIACGGFNKLEQFNWLQNLQHSIIAPVPSLFTFNMPKHSITQLMGVSVVNVQVKLLSTKLQQTGPILITHWGLSGPAILKLSAWAAIELAAKNYQFSISVNWVYPKMEPTIREEIKYYKQALSVQKITSKNPFQLPDRLWNYFIETLSIDTSKKWADINNESINKLVTILTNCVFNISGKTTFKEEFVTAGGINTNEIDVNTMQSKLHNSLFFAGEIMNVDGVTGGFNFQHAWTSGYLAAKAIAAKCAE
jgi:predicted Rossmann fold flavoprotein